jgi:hypothetical protein
MDQFNEIESEISDLKPKECGPSGTLCEEFHPLGYNTIYSVFQKTEIFITTAVRTSNHKRKF